MSPSHRHGIRGPQTSAQNQTDNNLVTGLVLAGVVAFLILAGAMFFNSDEKSADATPTPPSTESPVPD